jgi:hypothetical protein
MKRVLVTPFLTAIVFLAGCAASKEHMDAWVLYNHPGASILSKLGQNDEYQVYALCQGGQVIILQTDRTGGSPDIMNTNSLPLDRASCSK